MIANCPQRRERNGERQSALPREEGAEDRPVPAVGTVELILRPASHRRFTPPSRKTVLRAARSAA